MARRILAIDDSKIDAKVLKRAVAQSLHDVDLVHCETADAGLNYLLDLMESSDISSLPILVILDLNLPGIGGLDCLRAIKLNPKLNIIPVIILSTSDNPVDIRAAYANGAAAFMKKKLLYEEFFIDISSMLNFWIKTALTSS